MAPTRHVQQPPEATEAQEIELKLEFDPADWRRLEAAIARLGRGRFRHLVTTYFDTPERDLAEAGYTLRVRQSGDRYVQTVKDAGRAGAGLFARTEWERPLAGAQPQLDEGSGPIVASLGAQKLDRIQPVFVTDVRRKTLRLTGPDGDIELAVDRGEIRAGARSESLGEIECESRGAAIAPLFALARQLNEQVPLRLSVRAKSERGRALARAAPPRAWKAEPITLDRHAGAHDAFRVIALACIRHFRLNEAAVSLSGDAEALHQARVALRRLRSAFAIFKPVLGGDAKMLLLDAELRWLAGILGEVRNIDVLIEHLGGARARLRDARAQAFARARAELASSRTRLLMIDLAEWLSGDASGATARPARAHDDMRHFARARLEKLRHRLDHDGAGLGTLDDRRRHRVRIEAKKLRYAAEFFSSLFTSDRARRRYRQFIGELEQLQEALGALNDLVIGRGLAARHAVDPLPKKSGRRLRDRAEAAFDRLVRTKDFW
ncbi:MAG: CHAD domain-containing protein [Pseudomonadota bacterium]